MITLCYVATIFLTISCFTGFINDQKDTFSQLRQQKDKMVLGKHISAKKFDNY